jgi:hypothetical protein
MIRYRTAGLLLVIGCLSGCVDINGGAVELRWEIRKADGSSISCATAQVARVRLVATPVGGGDVQTEDWPCNDYEGATAFDVPPGRYAMVIAPLCTSGDPSAHVPDPIIRDVSNGNVAELNTLLIEKLPNNDVICLAP